MLIKITVAGSQKSLVAHIKFEAFIATECNDAFSGDVSMEFNPTFHRLSFHHQG